jgi:hypothetical protein
MMLKQKILNKLQDHPETSSLWEAIVIMFGDDIFGGEPYEDVEKADDD